MCGNAIAAIEVRVSKDFRPSIKGHVESAIKERQGSILVGPYRFAVTATETQVPPGPSPLGPLGNCTLIHQMASTTESSAHLTAMSRNQLQSNASPTEATPTRRRRTTMKKYLLMMLTAGAVVVIPSSTSVKLQRLRRQQPRSKTPSRSSRPLDSTSLSIEQVQRPWLNAR